MANASGRTVMPKAIKLATVAIFAACIAAGCATAPTDPTVFALPGRDKTLEQFTADDTKCREYASERERSTATRDTATAYDMQRRYDTAYIQCMYAAGHRVPVAGVFSTQPPGPPPPPPPPSAPPPPQK